MAAWVYQLSRSVVFGVWVLGGIAILRDDLNAGRFSIPSYLLKVLVVSVVALIGLAGIQAIRSVDPPPPEKGGEQ